MPQPFQPSSPEIIPLTRWPAPLATAPTAWRVQEPGPGSSELCQRVTAWYAQLRALPRRLRRALQRKLALPLAGVALLLALGYGPSQAATTWSVCASGCAYTTIPAAIDATTTAAGNLIAVRDPVHTEAGITVTKDVSIAGQGADATVVQAAATPGTARDRVVTIAPGVTVTIQALTLRHGATSEFHGGGGILNEGTLTLLNSSVSGNSASWGGGGIANFHGTVMLTNSTVSSNSAAYGGGLSNYGRLTLTNSIVANNPRGGDCLNEYGYSPGDLISQGTT
jgi:hypothetical protein